MITAPSTIPAHLPPAALREKAQRHLFAMCLYVALGVHLLLASFGVWSRLGLWLPSILLGHAGLLCGWRAVKSARRSCSYADRAWLMSLGQN